MTDATLPPTTAPRPAGAGAQSTVQPTPPGAASIASASRAAHALLDEVCQVVVGKRPQLNLIMAGLLAGGHVLLDDVPGVAKTLTARSIAQAAGLQFSRIQFTPDVLPSDITGYNALDLRTNEPVFRPGPIFAQLLLSDEINRAPAKTQAAMLEAMQERRVTIDGTTHELMHPFLVIATQNPVESEGTYPLPEAQLDRFILRTEIGYPTTSQEVELLQRRIGRKTDEQQLRQILQPSDFAAMIRAVELVQIHDLIVEYIARIVEATRTWPELQLGSSPRGSLALVQVSRALALLSGRDFVTPDDVRAVAVPVLSHRVLVTDEAWARQTAATEIVRRVVDSVAAPTWN